MKRIALALALAVAACGGSKKEAQEPVVDELEDEDLEETEEPTDTAFVPPEKFDELKTAFNLKRPQVARCYRRAVEDGAATSKDEGRITLNMTVTAGGRAKDITVAKESTMRNPAVQSCVKELILSWSLPAPGADVAFSYAYDFEHNW